VSPSSPGRLVDSSLAMASAPGVPGQRPARDALAGELHLGRCRGECRSRARLGRLGRSSPRLAGRAVARGCLRTHAAGPKRRPARAGSVGVLALALDLFGGCEDNIAKFAPRAGSFGQDRGTSCQASLESSTADWTRHRRRSMCRSRRWCINRARSSRRCLSRATNSGKASALRS
jgi:hypothetical protein